MQGMYEVYWEYAFLENFMLDGMLLRLALRCARVRQNTFLLLCAACLGGVQSIFFPLIPLSAFAAAIVKCLGGVTLAVVAVPHGSPPRVYLVTAVSFFLLTFLLGGILTALLSGTGGVLSAGGYYMESAPFAFFAGVCVAFALLCRKGIARLFRYRGLKSWIFPCELVCGGRKVKWKGFLDSGNRLRYRGRPVCVLSPAAALALFEKSACVGRLRVGTVNAERDAPLFSCEQMTLVCGREKRTYRDLLFTVGEIASREYQILLHSALLSEEMNETTSFIESMAAKETGNGERHTLSQRK